MAKQVSEQALFNRIVRGLAKQGWRRSADGDVCLYRGPEGDL